MSHVLRRATALVVLAFGSLTASSAAAQQIMVTVTRGRPADPANLVPADPLNNPQFVAFDNAGNLFISDTGSSRIRRLEPNGVMTTVVGTGTSGTTLGGVAATATPIACPAQLAFDPLSGALFFSDLCQNIVYKVSTGADNLITGAIDEVIMPYAGNGQPLDCGFSDGVPATQQGISPTALAVDQGGNLFIASHGGCENIIRRVDASSGLISTMLFLQDYSTYSLAFDGAGNLLFGVDYGIAMAKAISGQLLSGNEPVTLVVGDLSKTSSLFAPGLAFDRAGNLYISNGGCCVPLIYKVTPGSDGLIGSTGSTGADYAGTRGSGFAGIGYSGDGGSPTDAKMNQPQGIAVNGAGNLFIADSGNNVIRAVINGAPTDGTMTVQALDQNGNPSPVHLTFAGKVTMAGATAVVVGPDGPGVPANFQLAAGYFDIVTTAQYTGSVTVCIDSPFSTGAGLIHFENGSWAPDNSFRQGSQICTIVSSLSPFAIVTRAVVNQPPAVSSASAVTFQTGVAGAFTVTTTGAPIPTIAENGALPGGVTFGDHGDGTGALSGTPGASGVYGLTFTAHNGAGADAVQAFTLTVNQSPAITSAGAVTFTAGSAGAFTVTSRGYPVPGLTETGALPGGVTFTDNHNGTGTLSGTPSASGVFVIGFTASNGVGTDASQSFTLTVLAGASSLIVTPTGIDFGKVPFFRVAARKVTLQNTGAGAISIGPISLIRGPLTDWDDFFFVSLCKPSLAAGKSCDIEVFYFADDPGTRTATLTIASSAPGGVRTVSLAGTGIAAN